MVFRVVKKLVSALSINGQSMTEVSLGWCSRVIRMIRIFAVLVVVFFNSCHVHGYPDLTPEAITVYRNPNFFKNLNYGNYGTKFNYKQKTANTPSETTQGYKYPGETKKPNPPPSSPGFEVNYDNSPEFHHEPRDIFVDTTYKPTKKKGPYSPLHDYATSSEQPTSTDQKPVEEKETESYEKDSGEKGVHSSDDELQDYASVFNEKPDDEFRSYHEPVLLARPGFDPYTVVNREQNEPYTYNRTGPVLYEDWKYQNYPKIDFNEHLKSDSSRVYSEEPPSNSFDDDSSSSYYKDDDEGGDEGLFESDEFKNLGADTKHIYKKLLKPKKSFSLKFHSKPKFKKLKFKLKKKHNKDWFDEYPFDF